MNIGAILQANPGSLEARYFKTDMPIIDIGIDRHIIDISISNRLAERANASLQVAGEGQYATDSPRHRFRIFFLLEVGKLPTALSAYVVRTMSNRNA